MLTLDVFNMGEGKCIFCGSDEMMISFDFYSWSFNKDGESIKELIEEFKRGERNIDDIGHLYISCPNRACKGIPFERTMEYVSDHLEAPRENYGPIFSEKLHECAKKVDSLFREKSYEELQKIFNHELCPLSDEVVTTEIKMTAPVYVIKNFLNLIRLIESNNFTGGHEYVDLTIHAHYGPVKFEYEDFKNKYLNGEDSFRYSANLDYSLGNIYNPEGNPNPIRYFNYQKDGSKEYLHGRRLVKLSI